MTHTPPASGHPRGLYILFFTELWERYSFYSMMAILTLYMDEVLRFDAARIGRVYGAIHRRRLPACRSSAGCWRIACSVFAARSSPVACS